MVHLVYENAISAGVFKEVLVATCDEELADHVVGFGGRAVMTSSSHERASDRTAEAVRVWEAESGVQADVICMLQGDEPMISGAMLAKGLGSLLADHSIKVANLMGHLSTQADLYDSNCIKVVCDVNLDALYMSRSAIPYMMPEMPFLAYKQVCAIYFSRAALESYSRMEQTPLERAESIDMLRFLENGIRVRMILCEELTFPVDEPKDLDRVIRLLVKK